MLGEGELGLLKVMADGRLYTLNALAEAAAQRDWEAAGRLARLAELGLVEALELRKAGRQGLERAKAYRITPEGLRVVGASQPAEPSAVRAERGGAAQLAARLGEHKLQLLRVMADGALWRGEALRAALGGERAGEVAGPLGRLVELGLAERLELRTAVRRQGGFASVPVYRITPQGLAVLERGAGAPALQRERRSEQRKRPGQRDPAELLKAMADGGLYTLAALAKALGWKENTVKRHLKRLVERGEVEPVEVRVASWKSGTVATARVYRLKRGGAANPPSGREVQLQAPKRGGRSGLDILLAMSDGALWTVKGLSLATRHRKRTVRLHLRRLAELGLVEAVEVRMARRKGLGFAVACVYRIARKGLEALESGQLPPLKPEWEPPEDGDPASLALWVLEWSAQAARMLLHLYARGEDSWSGVLRAASGYRRKLGGVEPAARLLRLRELGLVEWELLSPDRAEGARKRAKRLVRLTERGREVARAILELTTLPLEAGQDRGRGTPETSGGCPPPERIAMTLPTTWEPPEGGNPLRLAIWVVNWSAWAARILLHLRSRAGYEDTWRRVAVAAGGYRHPANSEKLGATLFRLRELGLVEWELLSPERSANLPGRPKRIVRLTERGRRVADLILKLEALLSEAGAERGS
jgi:predicted ArsR family transcriptional regulator